MEKCPAGFTAGWAAPDGDAAGRAAPGRTWRQMIKDGRFYVMMFMLVCGAFSGLMVTSQAAMMAQERVGMTAGMAALAVSVLALFNTMGRVAAGVLSDFMGRLGVLRTVFALELAGLLVLTAAGRGETAFFLAGLSVMGLCFGALMGIYPGFTADRFGAEHNSVNYGIMFIGFALAGFFGPMTAGRILDISDSYNGAFAVAAALAAVGFLASLLPQRLPKKLWHRGGKCDEMSIISQ